MVDIKIIFLAFIVGCIFLISCNDSREVNIKDVKSDKITGEVVAGPKNIPNKTKYENKITEEPPKEPKNPALVKEYYDAEKLTQDLKEIFDVSYYNFTRDNIHPSYIKSSNLKYYAIHTSNHQINTFDEFCKYYCGPNWEGFKFYINNTVFDLYIPILDKSNFPNENEYKDYTQDRVLVNFTRKEKIFDVKNGKVLEYKFWFLEQDESGNFESNLMPYLLIYKIYCSPNITVFIRPRWERFSVSSPGKITQLIINWELEDDRVREELLNRSNDILEICGVENQFFGGVSYNPYFESEMRAYYFKTHYKYSFNLTSDISISAKKKTVSGDDYLLKEVNVSFTNDDAYDLEEIKLKIIAIPDGEREQTYFESDEPIATLLQDKTLKRSFNLKEIEFKNNITIISSLYTDYQKAEIRPLKVTFTKKGIGFE